MRVLIFGASGMVGLGVLRECLLDPDVHEVLAVVRRPLDAFPSSAWPARDKLVELVVPDPADLAASEPRLVDIDACFFCLGTSAAGMNEATYRKVTYDLTLAAATTLARVSPDMTFMYVSGTGTDSTEKGRAMWARVKGATENALLALPFKAAYMLRPGLIRPRHGITSRTRWLRFTYAAMTPLFPVLKLFMGRLMTTTDELGRAMLHIAKHGAPTRVLENKALAALGRETAPR